MKKMIFTMMAAVMVSTSAMAQDAQNDQRPERKFDKAEMVKHRTDETVSRYKLNDKQAKQLLELNTKYADKMEPRGPRHHHHDAGRPPMPPKDMKGERPEPPKDMKGERPEPPKDMKCQCQKPPKDDNKMKERHQEMKAAMEAYDAELQKIMTEDQYKNYKADQKNFHKKHHGHQKDAK